jgi:hypothetical protein
MIFGVIALACIFVAMAALGLLFVIKPRSIWNLIGAPQYKNPEAVEPSELRFEWWRVRGLLMMAAAGIGLFFVLQIPGNQRDVRCIEHEVAISGLNPPMGEFDQFTPDRPDQTAQRELDRVLALAEDDDCDFVADLSPEDRLAGFQPNPELLEALDE